MSVELHGFQYSVYSWIARLAIHEKGVAYDWAEVNPFVEQVPEQYLALHPFKRVPTLVHGRVVIYETSAITRYVDEAFKGPVLQRTLPTERARCNQIISVADSYAYWPLVRQVFGHGVFRPRLGRPSDAIEVRQGLDAAPRVVGALEKLVSDSPFLCGTEVSLADIHLAPMLGYFAMFPEGKALLDRHERLGTWWSMMSNRETIPKKSSVG
jgi:glutathione S-transferase